MKRGLRLLQRAALGLGVLVLAVIVVGAGVLFWAASSESGLEFVWKRAGAWLPAGISVATVEGRLAGPLVLNGIALQT
jgi:hypothetical protein